MDSLKSQEMCVLNNFTKTRLVSVNFAHDHGLCKHCRHCNQVRAESTVLPSFKCCGKKAPLGGNLT